MGLFDEQPESGDPKDKIIDLLIDLLIRMRRHPVEDPNVEVARRRRFFLEEE